jgi:hypothetical protein
MSDNEKLYVPTDQVVLDMVSQGLTGCSQNYQGHNRWRKSARFWESHRSLYRVGSRDGFAPIGASAVWRRTLGRCYI